MFFVCILFCLQIMNVWSKNILYPHSNNNGKYVHTYSIITARKYSGFFLFMLNKLLKYKIVNRIGKIKPHDFLSTQHCHH